MQYRVGGDGCESEVDDAAGPFGGTTACTNPTATKICNTSSNTVDDEDDGVGLVRGAADDGAGLGRGSGCGCCAGSTSEVSTCGAPGVGAGWVGRTTGARSWPGGGASMADGNGGAVVDGDVAVDKTRGGMLYSI